MNTKLTPTFLPLLLTALSIPILCQNNNHYQTCTQPFRCGSLNALSYPFWGGNRSISCGYPGFGLACHPDQPPSITIASITYRLLEINPSSRTLRVSRTDLLNDLCPTSPPDTTLNFTLFDFYRPADDRNITLYYGCPTFQPPPAAVAVNYMFNCSGFNPNVFNFFITSEDSGRLNGFGDMCGSRINVPVGRDAARDLGNPALASMFGLRASIEGGFSIEYAADERCDDCVRSGGVCGYDDNTASFACYCRNGAFGSNCAGSGNGTGNGSKNTAVRTGLFIAGGVLAGIGVGWLVLYYRQRRKKQHVERLGTPRTESKDASAALSSNKSLYTPPSTTFTKSIPSYPTSKSDLGMASAYFGAQVFDYAELEQATENFDTSKELGDGGFGTVYYGVLSDGRVVAVKRLYENNFKRVEQFMNEVEILTRLRHANLVTLYGCTSKRSRELLLVYEYVPNGTVADHLNGKRAKSGLLSWPIRLNIAIETAEALAYLHKSDIIHRDVKTNNILLDNDFHVKVADFGLSRLFPTDVTHVSTAPQGTPGYVDPEYYQCYQLTEKSDVYSFGVVLIELLSSLPAVDTNRHRHDINLANMAVNKIQNHTLHELVEPSLGFETNSSVRRMITLVSELAFRCLQQEKDMRPSMEEVLEALRGIQNEDLNSHKVEIVDILVDDERPLKDGVDPPSSESSATEKSTHGSAPGFSESV